MPLIRLGVAFPISASCTWAGVAPGVVSRSGAAAPATCGVAMDVPLMVFVDWSPVFQSDVVFTPGAKISTHGPKLENDAMLSLMSVAPTVSASGALAGEVLQASGAPELPAATAYTTPAAIEFSTAGFSGWRIPPPGFMWATDGRVGWAFSCGFR